MMSVNGIKSFRLNVPRSPENSALSAGPLQSIKYYSIVPRVNF